MRTLRRPRSAALAITVFILIASSLDSSAQTAVQPGVDVLIAQGFAPLVGKRVGLVINHTSVTSDPRTTTLDAFLATDRCRVTALFAPEHGIDGAALAGQKVGAVVDRQHDLPVYSLYGATRRPTKEMLRNVDVMVYDIQDIGVRSYTFISTLINVMEGCADAGVPVVVLDRPNPIGGTVVDGPVLDPAFRSFVGIVPVPYVYGLTAGELATMANSEGWLDGGRSCDLSVIRMHGWRRSMRWRETGLQWIPTSPHVPTPEAAFANAVTGAIGEIGVVSIGIGYTLPFELIGATWMDGRAFADRMNGLNLEGLYFRPTSYQPFYGMSHGQVCGGVQLMRIGSEVQPFTATIALLTTLRDAYPDRKLFESVATDHWAMFDKVCGGDTIRRQLLAGASFEQIVSGWRAGLDAYIAKRAKYLLYQ